MKTFEHDKKGAKDWDKHDFLKRRPAFEPSPVVWISARGVSLLKAGILADRLVSRTEDDRKPWIFRES